jgi:hypothetical protein
MLLGWPTGATPAGTYRLADASAPNIQPAVLRVLLEGAAAPAFADSTPGCMSIRGCSTGAIQSPWLWLGGFIAVDFCFWWAHRSLHRYNLLWGAHQPHHSAGLQPVALQRCISDCFRLAVYCPWRYSGCRYRCFSCCSALQLAYQFWITVSMWAAALAGWSRC